MKDLKNLTQAECIEIATIAEPNVKWQFIQSKTKWDGYDLIGIDDNEEKICQNIFQIDFRSEEELSFNSRFRLYFKLEEFLISNVKLSEIYCYLESIK